MVLELNKLFKETSALKLFTKTSQAQRQRLRAAYGEGMPTARMNSHNPELGTGSPIMVMDAPIDTCHLTLADVSCVDGWWPRSAQSELDNDDIERLIRQAIESTRARWSCEPGLP